MNATGSSDDGSIDRRTEKRLIDRAKRGDRASMRVLIDAHKDPLFAFIWRVVRNHHDAEEVCQDAFLRAFTSLHSFSPEYRFSTWLFTIAYRLALNSLRRKKALSGDMDLSGTASGDLPVEIATAQSEEARRLKEVVWSAVNRLSPPQRAAVVLFYRHEQSCREIAQVLQLPVATVKSHLHRARGRLKELLAPVVSEESSRLRILAELAG